MMPESKKKHPDISVVIPTKNRLLLLERAVKSVLAQTVMPASLIIVNDGSTDGTGEFLQMLAGVHPFVTILSHEESRGVNAARNRALRALPMDAWALLLDDDDILLPDAIQLISDRLREAPIDLSVAFFNTQIVTPSESFVGGYQFTVESGQYVDVSYLGLMRKTNMRGDCKPALHGSLFAKEGLFFPEDVNGFESEYYYQLLRDGHHMRFYRDSVMRIDQAHGLERLSQTAGQVDPLSFARVHLRMMRDHAALYEQNPRILRKNALSGIRLAIRARDPRLFTLFAVYLLRSLTALQKKPQGEQDIEAAGDESSDKQASKSER